MLAKIAHALSVATVGFEGVEYFLPPIILGSSPYFSQFIGGVGEKGSNLEPPAEMEVTVTTEIGGPYLIARMTFFGNRRFPTYEVVSGKITDSDLILPKIASMRFR
jgi:hypothetical protein